MTTTNPILRNAVTVMGNVSSPRAMVFVHGFGADQSVWKAVASSFLADYKVVLLDNVGSGNTVADDFVQHRYLNLERYALDLIEVVEALDLKHAVVVGHSVGGMISLLASIRAPARFSTIVVIGSSPRYRNDEGYYGGLPDEDINNIYELAMTDYPNWTRAYGIAAMANPDRPELAKQFVESLRKIPKERTITILCSILQSDYRNILGRIEHPTLIIQSARDSVVPLGVAEYLHGRIRGSSLFVVDAEGHFPHITATEAVVNAMRAFLHSR